MHNPRAKTVLCVSAAAAALLLGVAPAQAQQQAKATTGARNSEVTEVIVTARKRQESILNVPVIETAVPRATLEKFQVQDLIDLQNFVPGLGLGKSVLSIGTLVSIRGIGTSSTDPGVDQSVSLNFDGMSITQGLVYSSAMFDMAQVEVLKGPQALFYGRSSPGGVISIRSADPTNTQEIIARLGYDLEARQVRTEFIASGPLTDTVKGRLAMMYSNGQGYFNNGGSAVPGSGGVNPDLHSSGNSTFFLRGTLLWNPTNKFDARLKVNYINDYVRDAETGELDDCVNPGGANFAPAGIPFIANDDCKLNRDYRNVYMDPKYFPGTQNNGVPFVKTIQNFGTLEMNYHFTPQLNLSSTTGIYQLNSQNSIETGRLIPPVFTSENQFQRRDWSEEVRMNSDFSGPWNFTLGGLIQEGRISDHVFLVGNAALKLPARLTDGESAININAKSVYGQLRWKIIPKLELTAGARYTVEKRDETVINYLTHQEIGVRVPAIESKTTSPEFSATYRPTDDVTLFASWKKGAKPGSFSIGTITAQGADNSFGDEHVQGWETGVKSRLFERSLLLNLAFFDYHFKGLQVGAIEQQQGGVPIIHTINAGAAETIGVDFDATYRPPQIDGLSLNLAVSYDHARYTTLNNITCWSGQTIAQGCNRFFNPTTGRYTAEDASGTPLIRAPDWQVIFGFDYVKPLSNGMKLEFTSSNTASTTYVTFPAINRPHNDNWQPGYFKSDLNVTLTTADDRWEFAVIANNLGNVVTSGLCSASFYSSGLILNTAGQITGAASTGSAGMGEKACYADPGRSVWLRFTFKPLAGR
jgi:iron complex outermembrane receptor protein